MPKFLTLSPTHVSGEKENAWNHFLAGGYIAIGWIWGDDLSGKSIEKVVEIIQTHAYANEAYAVEAFTKFLALEKGDYIAINNTNDGLFGIGIITSEYKYEPDKHPTGGDEKNFYSHYRDVDWIYTNYVKRKDVINPGEKGWKPYGTVGSMLEEVPPYIKRIIGEELPKETPDEVIRPEKYLGVIESIERLKNDQNHSERDHESLVEHFLVALGYGGNQEIKYRRGRIDVAITMDDNIVVIIEVKKDWNLNAQYYPQVVQQGYMYALDQGVRYVLITNGDYYAIFDRLKGLSTTTNLIGEFRLSSLKNEDLEIINIISPEKMNKPDLKDLFQNLSEHFP